MNCDSCGKLLKKKKGGCFVCGSLMPIWNDVGDKPPYDWVLSQKLKGKGVDLFCSHYCLGIEGRRKFVPSKTKESDGGVYSYDPDRIINEYGAVRLSETSEGQEVLRKARKKYAAELVQPGDPEFNKLYGKEVKERQEAQRELRKDADRQWAERGGRERLHEN